MKAGPSYLYFLRPVGMPGPIKIGVSKFPKNRRGQMSAISPFPLELITQTQAERQIEGRVHTLLRAHHSHSEWFHAHSEVLAVVQSVADGTFDPSSLPDDLGPVRFLRKREREFDTVDWEYAKIRDDFWNAHLKIGHARGFKRGGPWPIVPSVFHLLSAGRKQTLLAFAKQQIDTARELESLAA